MLQIIHACLIFSFALSGGTVETLTWDGGSSCIKMWNCTKGTQRSIKTTAEYSLGCEDVKDICCRSS